MAAIIGQVAGGEAHHLGHIPVLGLGDVGLAELRLHLSFVVAPVEAEGVVDAGFPLAVERTLKVQIKRAVGALEVIVETPVAAAHHHVGALPGRIPGRIEVREAEGIGAAGIEHVAVVHEQAAAIGKFGVVSRARRRCVHRTDAVQQRVRVADVVDRGLEVAIGELRAEQQLLRQQGLEAQDVLVLVHVLQVGRRESKHIDGRAVLAVGRNRSWRRSAIDAGDRRESRRPAVLVDSGVVEVLVGERRGRGATNGHVVRHRQEVATGVGEHLEAGVAEEVPGQSQTRRPLVLRIHIDLTTVVLVGELVVADTQRQQQVVRRLPAVLQIPGLLVERHAGIGEVGQLAHVVAVAARGTDTK